MSEIVEIILAFGYDFNSIFSQLIFVLIHKLVDYFNHEALILQKNYIYFLFCVGKFSLHVRPKNLSQSNPLQMPLYFRYFTASIF